MRLYSIREPILLSQTVEINFDEQVELCRNGDRHAYFELYRQYARPMLNSSMRIVNNLADAEDMVQEAFADAFKNIQSFTYKSSFEAWLRRIVINKSISLLRKKKMIRVDIEPTNAYAANNDTLNNNNEVEYDVLKIKNAIAQLPHMHRVIFNLFTIDEMPQEEIGKLLGISHNNVRTIYHRARKKIIDLVKLQSPHE